MGITHMMRMMEETLFDDVDDFLEAQRRLLERLTQAQQDVLTRVERLTQAQQDVITRVRHVYVQLQVARETSTIQQEEDEVDIEPDCPCPCCRLYFLMGAVVAETSLPAGGEPVSWRHPRFHWFWSGLTDAGSLVQCKDVMRCFA